MGLKRIEQRAQSRLPPKTKPERLASGRAQREQECVVVAGSRICNWAVKQIANMGRLASTFRLAQEKRFPIVERRNRVDFERLCRRVRASPLAVRLERLQRLVPVRVVLDSKEQAVTQRHERSLVTARSHPITHGRVEAK